MQDVLVPVPEGADATHAMHCAARVAAGLGGRLTGLHPVPVGAPPPSLYDPGFAAAEWAIVAQREVREANEAGDGFVAWARGQGLERAKWMACAGYLPELLGTAAQWHDLLVLGLERNGEDPWSSPAGVARIVLASPVPCLVVPDGVAVAMPPATVAIAWNGSMEAIRAVHAALPILRLARRVVIVSGAPVENSPMGPRFSADAWLAERLPAVERVSLAEGGDTGARLLEQLQACGAEMLVMGAYGRSRASEWLLGGVTRHLLQHADVALLMRH